MVIASFLDVGKRFFTQGRCLQCTPLHLIPPSHTTLKEETRREEGKRERERDIEREIERESQIEETDKNSHQVLEIDETWCDLHSWLFATTTGSV